MRQTAIHSVLILMGLAGWGCAAAGAQAEAARAISRTDIAVSLYGAFSGATTGNNVQESPSNSAGGMIEIRHIVNPIVGYEGTYSFNRGNQTYTSCPAPFNPLCEQFPVLANAHEVSGDWVASLKVSNLRPFALAGVGFLFDVPTGGQTGTTINTKPMFMGQGLTGEFFRTWAFAGNFGGTCTRRPISLPRLVQRAHLPMHRSR